MAAPLLLAPAADDGSTTGSVQEAPTAAPADGDVDVGGRAAGRLAATGSDVATSLAIGLGLVVAGAAIAGRRTGGGASRPLRLDVDRSGVALDHVPRHTRTVL